MNKLQKIYNDEAAKYGSCPETFTDKGSVHNYLTTYFTLLENKSFCKIFEIGVRTGGSIWLWKNFLPNYEIWGIDLDIGYFARRGFVEELESDPKINVKFSRNSFDSSSYEDIPKDFDLIIDDGDHSHEGIIKTFVHAWNHLKIGGTYVIEDAQSDYAINTVVDKVKIHSPNSVIEIKKFRPDSDDNLIIISKKEN